MLAFYFTVFGSFLCLIPLALYCLSMAGFYRRRTPTLVTGPAEFAWAVIALSGFLIIGGPAMLAGWHEVWRRTLFRGSFADIRGLLDDTGRGWILLWAGYYFTVAAVAVAIYRRRLGQATICNIASADVEPVLATACERLDLPVARRGSVLVLGGVARSAELVVSTAPVLRSATIVWRSDPADMRPIVEEELRRVLAGVAAPVNPVAGRLTLTAVVLFTVQFVAFTLLALFLYDGRN